MPGRVPRTAPAIPGELAKHERNASTETPPAARRAVHQPHLAGGQRVIRPLTLQPAQLLAHHSTRDPTDLVVKHRVPPHWGETHGQPARGTRAWAVTLRPLPYRLTTPHEGAANAWPWFDPQ